MPRIARVVIPGIPHHVTQRGNRQMDVFRSVSDRKLYLSLLTHYGQLHGLRVLAYCLMDNHVHLVLIPERAESLCLALKPLHLRYAQEYNHRTGQSGILWQGRYYSCPLGERHTWAAIRYVERNPVRARIVTKAERYPWSSAAVHCALRADDLVSGFPGGLAPVDDWSAWLAERDDAEEVRLLRSATRTGRPLGDADFVRKLEKACGRILHSLGRGRPRKHSKTGRNKS